MSPDQPSFTRHLPVSAFAMVMGLSGLTLVWARAASLGWLAGVAGPVATGLGVLTAVTFVVLGFFYARKAISNRPHIREEWHHPVKSSFFATVSISFALLGTVALGLFAPFALTLWALGASLQVVAMLMVLNAWVHRETFLPGHANPAWFIPAVGNVVMPLAGVKLGFYEISWWFFSAGLVFWIALLTVILARLLFVQPPMPERLIPTFCIFLAPPAVSFLSWLVLTGQYPGSAELDAMGHVLYGIALFFALFLASQSHRFARLPFYLSWWAFSFPTAAFTTATMVYAQFVKSPLMQGFSAFMMAFATALIAWLFVRTVVAVIRREPQLID